MEYSNLKNFSDSQRRKAFYLINVASDLGIDLDGPGEIGVNDFSGDIYFFLKEYDFHLYMKLKSELNRDGIVVLYRCLETEHEAEIILGNKTLNDVENWVSEQYIKF